jgi:nodulation protein A
MTNPSDTYHLIAEGDLTPDHHQRISNLLIKVFPKASHIFSNSSYYFALPEYRLWIEDEQGIIIAHLDMEHRLISVGGVDVPTIGVGEVGTHPDYQGQGLGRKLMDRLKVVLREQFTEDYGILQCRDTVAGFYEQVGWHRVYQTVHRENIDTGEVETNNGPTMILPIHKTMNDWHTDGIIDIRGLPW